MRKSLLAASLVTAAIAAAGVGGIAFATASSGATATTEHFTILSTKPSGNGWVASRGPINGVARDTVLSQHTDRFTYAAGNLIVRHRRVGKPTQHFNKRSCLGTYHEAGVYTIVRGTGAYKGATGSGHYEVDAKVIGCSASKPPLVTEQDIEASGPLTR
ncbi:MAG TPA: hypothetical protein VFH38_02300 [Jatrophihabitans sp.]|nr:hypothetical protein [Jatrophihabitans sp.]